MADFGYDIADYTAIDPLFGIMADFDALLAGGACARPEGGARLRAQPHVGSSILGSRKAGPRAQSSKRDWYIWRDRRAGRRAAQQLAVGIRRLGLDARRADRAILLPRVPHGAAGPQLAQPGGARGHARCHALLAQARRRRLSRRRDLASDQGRARSATIRPIRITAQGDPPDTAPAAALFGRPAGGARRRCAACAR